MDESDPSPLNPSIPVTPQAEPQTLVTTSFPTLSQLLQSFTQEVLGSLNPTRPGQSATQTPSQLQGVAGETEGGELPSADPRFPAILTRVASYYQQHSRAIVDGEKQRCQEWADQQHKKCEDITNAAMLVVAWYVRDRIQRQRRKRKRRFRRGLDQTRARPTVSRGEAVRRWVMAVPRSVVSHNEPAREDAVDREEAEFSMDEILSRADEHTELFNMADGLIRSQLSSIDVPLLGILSLDDSTSQSEEEGEDAKDDDDEDEPGATAGAIKVPEGGEGSEDSKAGDMKDGYGHWMSGG